MSKVITFSRHFPVYHPKAGQPTFFVEKICNGLNALELPLEENGLEAWSDEFCESINGDIATPKYHTIRAGHRFKVGDKFSPRVWSGKPYRSKLIVIAPDIEIKKVWDFAIFKDRIYIEADFDYNGSQKDIAENDGLDLKDFLAWLQYPKPFDGQIICWNESIEY